MALPEFATIGQLYRALIGKIRELGPSIFIGDPSRQVAADAREYFGSKVFQSVVPRNVRLAEAPSFGKPIILYDVASVGAKAYMGVAKELIERSPVAAKAKIQSA